MATDAAYANGVARRGFCYAFMENLHTPIQHSMPPIANQDSHIGIEELAAAVDSLRHLRTHCTANKRRFPDIVLLGIDSSHAKGMITNSVARSPEALKLLQELDELLGTSRLFMVQVPSEANPSDCLTRPNLQWNQKLWSDLVARLQGVFEYAKFDMTKYGKKKSQQAHHQLPQTCPARQERRET